MINEQFDVFIQSTSIKVNTLGGVVLFIILIMGIGLLIFCKRFHLTQKKINEIFKFVF